MVDTVQNKEVLEEKFPPLFLAIKHYIRIGIETLKHLFFLKKNA